MTKTEHYQLNQWDASDYVRREDFNEDNRKIEEALAELNTSKCEIVFGTYTGNGANTRTITLGFMPKAVYVCNAFGSAYREGCHYGGLALEGHPAKATSYATGTVNLITIKENGFQVANSSVQSGGGGYISGNLQNTTYHYIAFR